MDASDDFALALQLQAQYDDDITGDNDVEIVGGVSVHPSSSYGDCQIVNVSNDDRQKMSLIDPRWETIDPIPDVRALFVEFNKKYFWERLAGIEVRWSPRMTLCAGLCVYEGRGGMCSVRLSEPLLKLRPRKDLIETLLHEMIHAYLFVTDNNKDHDGHGPEFCKHMQRLNKECGTKISIYHNFHDEVNHYQQHWWRCDGPCQTRKPYFGYVKRAMNRAPAPRDTWWAEHQATCGGTYTKVKEPEGYGKKKEKKKDDGGSAAKKPESTKGSPDIRTLFKKDPPNKPSTGSTTNKPSTSTSHPTEKPSAAAGSFFPGSGVTIGGSGTKVQGPIIRKLPGIGTITTERNNSNHKKEATTTTTITTPTNNKRTLPMSNSDASEKKKAKVDGERRRKSLSLIDFMSGKDATPPGTAEKVPGFRSTANRKNWDGKTKKNTAPIANNDIFIPLGGRPNVTPNSVLSKEERARLRQIANEAKSPPATYTPTAAKQNGASMGIWQDEVEVDRYHSRAGTSGVTAGVGASTSARDSRLWTSAGGNPVAGVRTGTPGASTSKGTFAGAHGTGAGDSDLERALSASLGTQGASAGAKSAVAGAQGTMAGAHGTSAGDSDLERAISASLGAQGAVVGAQSAGAGDSDLERAINASLGAPGTVAGAQAAVGGADEAKVACPVCSRSMPESLINAHLDTCLGGS